MFEIQVKVIYNGAADMKPLLSIVIPTYNREKFLDKTLENITSQLEPDVEIVISDDGSRDGTAAIAAKYQARFPTQITYRKKPVNERFDKNLLTAISLAKGAYCWFLSDDDFIVEGAVAKVLSEIHAAKESKFILLNYASFDSGTGAAVRERMIEFEDSVWSLDEFIGTPTPGSYFAFLGMNIIYMSAFVFEREAWNAYAGHCSKYIGTNFIHSFIFVDILGHRHLPVTYIGKPYVHYRTGNIRDWGNDIWHDFHAKFLAEARAAGVSPAVVRRVKLKYFPRYWKVKIGSAVKRRLRRLKLMK